MTIRVGRPGTGETKSVAPLRPEQVTVRWAGFTSLTAADHAALIALGGPFREVPRGAFLAHEGDRDQGCFLLARGWAASTMSFADGSRAMVKVHMAGDMLGGPGMALERSADTIVALTPCVVVPLSLEGIGALFETNPRLAAILFLIAQEERVMLMDRLAVAARGDALRQVAFLLVQLHARALRNDSANEHGFNLPLAQADLADIAGLATVHINRMLQRLKRDGIADWRRGRVTILDGEKLRQIAGLPRRRLARDPAWLPAAAAGAGTRESHNGTLAQAKDGTKRLVER